ncbi:hypothetical protein [Thioalkalivibrio denitrificans]|nr:hypothetical protein [Thioalkalivibrio denitrificans]
MKTSVWMTGVVLALSLWTGGIAGADDTMPTWEGWIVGGPCAGELRIADCPLRYVDQPVLLLEDGDAVPFRYGEGTGIRDVDIDESYTMLVRITGEREDGVIQSVRLDRLEDSPDRTFFKG